MNVFIAGGTGYIGQRLIPLLLGRGHAVRGLARPSSAARLPPGTDIVLGNALDPSTFVERVAPSDTYVHMVGVAHPSPAKKAEFRSIDLVATRASVNAATAAGARHFIYISVAQPAPVMGDYIAVRKEGERLIRESGLTATIFRPWYVLGPGHLWPYLLLPGYALLEALPATRETALRLHPVTIDQMVKALLAAIETPPQGIRIVTSSEIRGRGADRMVEG
jgi:uncharacterized protein YbjT (DUF2867 family)